MLQDTTNLLYKYIIVLLLIQQILHIFDYGDIMLKRAGIRRIAVASCALIILLIIYFFPHTDKEDADFIERLNYANSIDKSAIYLLDYNDYVAISYIVFNSQEVEKKIEEVIETLTIGGKQQDYIPNGFKAVIPEGTKLLNSSLDKNGLLKIDFSKELLEVKKENEEKMIEAIVFSLTNIEGVKKIMIFVDGEQLVALPHSKKNIPSTLDRSFGINKVYDIDNYKNSTKTTVYYVSKYNTNYYYVPVTFVNNNNAHKVEVIINELKSSPIYQTNLMSYLAAGAELLTYEVKENKISMSFNKYLLDDFENKRMLEEVKYTIALSLKDNFNVNEVIFSVEDEQISTVSLEKE